MKLLLPEIMHHLEKKPMMLQPADSTPIKMPVEDKKSRKILQDHFYPMMHQAEKYLFDSGSDKDDETLAAVKDTALAMMEVGFFHLPFETIWIEDPFEDNPAVRNFYLCQEVKGGIRIWAFQSVYDWMKDAMEGCRYVVSGNPLFLDLDNPTHYFKVEDALKGVALAQQANYAEIIYSVKKFIVTLNTEQTERERVKGKPFKERIPKIFREYDYNIVRVPGEVPYKDGESTGTRPFKPRPRRKLVAGYVWGKYTRPVEERRLIMSYWRGTLEPEMSEEQRQTVRVVEPRKIRK